MVIVKTRFTYNITIMVRKHEEEIHPKSLHSETSGKILGSILVLDIHPFPPSFFVVFCLYLAYAPYIYVWVSELRGGGMAIRNINVWDLRADESVQGV